DRGTVDLTIALRRVPVAGREQRTLVPHRKVDRAARRQLLAVEVSAEFARLLAVLPTEYRGGCHRELAEERRYRNLVAGRRSREVRFQIERNVYQLHVRKIFGDRPHVTAEEIPTPVLPELDVKDFDLEYISDRGATDIDWSGENVIAGSFLHLLMDFDNVRKNVEAAVLGRHPFGIAGGALDRYPLAGIDGERGLYCSIEIAPVHRLGRRPQKLGAGVRRATHVHGKPQLPGMIPGSML